MIEIHLWLYGKPSWDLEIEGKKHIDPGLLKAHVSFLKAHLDKTAELLEKLQKAGWLVAESYGAIYSLTLYKRTTKIKAQKELIQLGIKQEEVTLEQAEDF